MSPIHVALATDRRCLWGCAVAMRSIADQTAHPGGIHFHLLANGLYDVDRRALHETVSASGGGSTLTVVDFDPAPVRHLMRSKKITHTAYARIFLGSLLPDDVSRCVYVDCDVVFNLDIGELWRMDLENKTVGAVDNGRWEDPATCQSRLGLAEPEYFNSGVLLIDLDRWRSRDVAERALTFAEKAGDRLILHDQDALNGALQGDWLPLPAFWNVWVALAPELTEASSAVFHYMGTPKPWHPDYDQGFRSKFFMHLDHTAYAGSRPWNPLGLGASLARTGRRVPYLPGAVRIFRNHVLRTGTD